jgi:hypothetical protein
MSRGTLYFDTEPRYACGDESAYVRQIGAELFQGLGDN